MTELWSAQQHEWLTALGHTLYVPGSAEAPVVSAAPAVADPPVMRMPTSAVAPVPTRRRPEPDVPTPGRDTEPARRAASRVPDKLHFALIRASGCNPGAAGAAEIMARWPSSAELRGNPTAKRALWPQLRALRRSSLP
ncbi:MAG: alanine acetyltransferase [Lysobacteraceae bacterium]|nr:MAG: alanine acetyltransferase [Xanthomonadaceae bacterium]